MKRIFSIIIMVIIISSLSFTPNSFGVGFFVSASNETYAPTSQSDMENKITDFLQRNLDERNSNFSLTLTGDFLENIPHIPTGYNQVSISEPYFTTDPIYDYRYKPGNDYNAIAFSDSPNAVVVNFTQEITGNKITKVVLNYSIMWGETAAQRTQVDEFADSKISELGVSSMGEYDKVKTIHDFVIKYAHYDESKTNPNAYPYQMVTQQKGVCQAYAGLFYMLCKEAGIDVRIVIKGDGDSTSSGQTSGAPIAHAWNLVKINGNWYHLDATWDDPINNQFDIVRWKYYLKGDSTMSSNHFWDRSAYPAANSDYNYPTSLPEYLATPKTGATVASSKPKATTSSKAVAGQTATSNAPAVSSEQSTVTSAEASSATEEDESTESSEEVMLATQNTNINGGIKDFFKGGILSLYQKNKPLFIAVIIGIIVLLLALIGGFLLFLRRRKTTRSSTHFPFGGSYLN